MTIERATLTPTRKPTEAPTETLVPTNGDTATPIPATPVALASPTEAVASFVNAAPQIVVQAAPAEASAPPLVAAAVSGDVGAAGQYMVELINAQRAAAGAPPLARDETLMSIAQARVDDMVVRGYTGHNDPVTGEALAAKLIRAAGYTSSFLGENWYGSLKGPPEIVDVAMSWFMTDPSHARNILNPNYVGVGVGIAFNGRQWLLVQNFVGQ